MFINLVPVLVSILGVAVPGEAFRWYQRSGLALVLSGVRLAQHCAI